MDGIRLGGVYPMVFGAAGIEVEEVVSLGGKIPEQVVIAQILADITGWNA